MKKNGDNGDDLFSWRSRDHFGNREDGERAAFEAACEEWKELYYATADLMKARGQVVTSKLVVAVIGWPPGNHSRVGAVHNGWVKKRGLTPTGTEKALDRHQGHHHTW